MAKIVEQVDIDGNIVNDYDTSLSVKAIFEVISDSFPSVHKDDEGMICGEIIGKKFAIRAKNITYLGHPHPLYKKRIQIAGDLQEFYQNALKKGRTPILLGVYTYKENTLFCDFNIEDFITKKAHNSSAHVYTSDLSDATMDGFFYKEDYFGNKITVFTPKTVNAFLEDKLVSGDHESLDGHEIALDGHGKKVADNTAFKPKAVNASLEDKLVNRDHEPLNGYAIDPDKHREEVADSTFSYNFDFEVEKISKIVMEFFKHSNKKWTGIECYRTMIEADYRNKFQPEWPGFFLEFEFEKYLSDNNLTSLITYAQDKRKGGIDLDLFFPTIQMFGDLKAHSCKSNGIQGNDWGTVFGLIDDRVKDSHIYYIVGEHETYKDSEFEYEVTKFWNSAQGKENLMSYSKRMKNSVELTHAYVFDINCDNKQFLTKFRQGLNSNGKPREPKIMIEKDNFTHFILEESSL